MVARTPILFAALLLAACGSSQTFSDTGPTGEYVPTDLDDAFVRLDSLLGPDQIEQIRSMESENEFSASAHFGLGLWLRNNWGLWAGSRLAAYFNGIGIFHPDDMSGIILHSYYRQLKGEPILLGEQVAYYQAFWEEARQRQEAEEDGGQ